MAGSGPGSDTRSRFCCWWRCWAFSAAAAALVIWCFLPVGTGKHSTRRWAWTTSAGPLTPPSSPCTASRKPDGYNKAHLQEFGQVLQTWMISQIPGGAEGLDQLVCDGKTLRGSALETEDGSHRFVAQVTVYARALGAPWPRRRTTPVNPVSGLPCKSCWPGWISRVF